MKAQDLDFQLVLFVCILMKFKPDLKLIRLDRICF